MKFITHFDTYSNKLGNYWPVHKSVFRVVVEGWILAWTGGRWVNDVKADEWIEVVWSHPVTGLVNFT